MFSSSDEPRCEILVRLKEDAWSVSLEPHSQIEVGRDPRSGIRVDADTVADHHLRIVRKGDGIYAVDLGSTSGTWLVRRSGAAPTDGAPASNRPTRLTPHEPQLLQWGDSLWVGPATLGLPFATPTASLIPKSSRAVDAPRVLVDPEMKRIYALVARAAASNIAVLVIGETGTGKEALAQTVHQRSPRRQAPFLQLNCAALSESLLESELFGYEKGAFTGAQAAKQGLLEATEGGTIVLDELGELGLGIQAKLLRVLENHEVIRVGSTKARRIDVRFVASTNRDLTAEVARGRFRSDLYYRVSGLTVRIPPLRDRPSELGPLAKLFVSEFCATLGQRSMPILPAAHELMRAYHWPGNVRELKNVMERAVLLAEQHPIGAEHLLLDNVASAPVITYGADAELQSSRAGVTAPPSLPTNSAMSRGSSPDVERDRIASALETCGGNQTRAAELLGISRRTLINRIEQFQLPRPQKR